jgi:hypothetical protein
MSGTNDRGLYEAKSQGIQTKAFYCTPLVTFFEMSY